MYWNKFFFFYHVLTGWWPNAACLMPFKRGLLRLCGVKLGEDVFIDSSVRFLGSGKIVLGNRVKIYSGVQIGGRGIIEIADGVEIWDNCVVRANGRISIGRGTQVYQNNVLMANGTSTLRIEEMCAIAHMISLKTSTHDIDPAGPCIAGSERFDDIVIGAGTWICAGATVIPGVRIGKKNVIAAGSVVIKDTADYSLMAGVPAVCKKIYEEHK